MDTLSMVGAVIIYSVAQNADGQDVIAAVIVKTTKLGSTSIVLDGEVPENEFLAASLLTAASKVKVTEVVS
jgi:hypothetical protein